MPEKRSTKSGTKTNISLAEPAEATEKIPKEPTEIKDKWLVSFLCALCGLERSEREMIVRKGRMK
jgi:hypothetical protein